MQIILAFMGLLYSGMPTSYAVLQVKLIPSDVAYFSNEGSLTLTCTVNEDVRIATVTLRSDGVNYVGIFNPTSPQCNASRYTGDNNFVYSTYCDQEGNYTLVKHGTSADNHRKKWMCVLNSLAGGPCLGGNNPCFSQNVTSVIQVPVTTVQLMTGSGQVLSSSVNIVREQSTGIRCSTAPSGSRPRATFQWYIRQGSQSPVLIVDQSVSSTPDPITVPGQESDIVIFYSTWTLTGNASYHNMYIYCQARDETNTGNYTKSAEVQINIVYSPVVKLFPNQSAYNVTEGIQNFIFTCNIVEAEPLPQANGYSWFHSTSIIPGQTSSSYTLPIVQRSDAGEYKCTARNDYGNGTSNSLDLIVQYGPTISLVGTIDVEEGGTLSVTCSVSANPPPSVIWTRSGKVLSNSSVLVVQNISRLNDGEYICTASNVLYPTGQVPVMKTATDTLIVNILYGPGNSATIYPNVMMYEIEEGKTAQNIVCSAMCNPECSYKWLRNNTQISSQGTLSLGLVHINMTGRYVCEAYNTAKGGIRSSTVTIEIKIKYAPIVKLQAEVRNINPFRLKEGHRNVVLMCEIIAAYPLPTLYIWTHENEVQNGSGSTFTIPVATRQIDGIWGCKGINNYGTPSESQLQIDVQYGPIIDPIGNETAIEGQLFLVACNVKSNPPPVSISWIKDNNAAFLCNTSVLTINNVSRNDSGTYRCTAINKIHPSGENEVSLNGSKRFYLNVHYSAMIISLSVAEGNTVNENMTATLTCLVDSNPESTITWTKQGLVRSLKTDVYVHQSELTIGHADCLDTANYTCTASNGLGHPVERTIPLYVTCHPRTDFRSPPVSKVYSNRCRNASLHYTVISLPEPTFNWTFMGDGSENRFLPDSATMYDIGLQSVLMFRNLSINDFGFYKVIAKNVFPTSAIEVFQLIQAHVPEAPFNVTITDVKQTSLTVWWVARYNGGLEQTFHIMITAGNMTRSVYVSDPGYRKYGTQTIEDLMPNTMYGIYMLANNTLGSSNVTVIFQSTLQAVGMMEPEMKGSANMAAIAGGIGAAVVVVIILVVLFFIWRKKASMKNSSGFNNSIQGRSNQTGHLYANTSYSGDVSNTAYESLQACKTEASPYQALNSSSTESSDQNKDWSESMTIRSVGAGKIYINIANTSTLGDKEYESL